MLTLNCAVAPNQPHARAPLTTLTLVAICSMVCVRNDALAEGISSASQPTVIVNTSQVRVAPGQFQPSWESLDQCQAPDWFRNGNLLLNVPMRGDGTIWS